VSEWCVYGLCCLFMHSGENLSRVHNGISATQYGAGSPRSKFHSTAERPGEERRNTRVVELEPSSMPVHLSVLMPVPFSVILWCRESIAKSFVRTGNFIFSSQCQWADCECIVGGERIPAHRCILVARSGFFEGTRCPSMQVEVQVQI
jgi:hypothetical protein